MDLGYGNPKAGKWVTNVGLVFTDGPIGSDVMAAEWVYYVSYSPALITVHIGHGSTPKGKATLENIRASKEFAVSMASSGQQSFSSIAGSGDGHAVDMLAVMKDMGAEFFPAKHVNALHLKGATMHIECKVKDITELGDHYMVVGEVLDIVTDDSQEPLVYSFGKYHAFGRALEKPSHEVRDHVSKLKEKHARK